MQMEDLIELAKRVQAQQAEAQTVEVKAAHRGCPSKLRDTLSSFSNQNSGGILLFGLDENEHFAAVGVYDLQDLQKKVTEQCNQMQPPVRALFTTAEYEGVWICSAEIPSIAYAERPCYYIGAGIQNGSYVRVGDADRHMTDYEIYCFEAYRNHMHDDELKSIMGLVKTPHGAIELDGEDIIRRPTYERAAAGLGYVPQGRDIFPQMTVQENLELALYAQKKHGKVPDYIYDLFPILPKFAARRGGDLSGGQQQQLAIARALVADPKVLILDEPTEGIQPSVIADIGTAIQRVNKELGLTVLLVEQYLDFVLENTTQLHVMEKGAPDILKRCANDTKFQSPFISWLPATVTVGYLA